MVSRRSFASTLAVSLGCLLGLCATLPVAQAETAPSTVAAADVDPLNDPWLTQEGPAVAVPEAVAKERVKAAWAAAPERAHARSAALLRTRLEFGLGDLVPPAEVISREYNPDEPALYTGLARELAPGVPSFQADHALALFRDGDVGGGILALSATGWAVATSLPAEIWLLENVSQMLLIVLLTTAIVFILLAFARVLPHAAHDFGDLLSGRLPTFGRYAAVAAIVLTPLVFREGVLGLMLVLFTIAFAYGDGRHRNALALAGVLLIIAIHPLAHFVSVATNLLDRDPVVGAVLSVLEGTESAAEVELLEEAFDSDLVAAHGLVYRARRYGLEEVSRERMVAITEHYPSDGVVLANLGNIEKRRGKTESAIDYYERAAMQLQSPTLLFALSQAYASAFLMEEYEATLVRAQSLGDREVAALSNFGDPEMVADIPFPVGLLRDRLVKIVLSERTESGSIVALAPGFLGENWMISAGAFALVGLLCLLFSNLWDHASTCVRCGHRICTRCEETVWSEEICEDCHHLFQYPEATDPSLRMARLQALSVRESRFDKIWLSLSLLVPGMAGFAARRPDFAIFGLLLFSWAVVWGIWPAGIQPDPMLMGSAAVICFAIPGVLAVLTYFGVVIASLVLRKLG